MPAFIQQLASFWVRASLPSQPFRLGTYRGLKTQTLEQLQDLIYTQGGEFFNFIGPVKIAQIKGKGRGVVTTSDVKPGELILLSQPLCIAHGPSDALPDVSLLKPMLESKLADKAVRYWLPSMFDGVPEKLGAIPDLQFAVNPSSFGVQPLLAPQLLNLENVIALNAFGDQYEDLAAADVRKQTAHSQVGIWPEFSFFNHSCIPNCIHYVLGDTMVVRAVRNVAGGEELTVSYLGREEFTPLTFRGPLLQERYGFTCNCPRCTAEMSLSKEASELLVTIQNSVRNDVQPAFVTAIQEDNTHFMCHTTAQALRDLAFKFSQVLRHAPQNPPFPVTYLQSAVYDLFEMMYMYDEVVNQNSTTALRLCMHIVRGVSPGCELHVFQASKLQAQLEAEVDDEASNAEMPIAKARQVCEAAHYLRYGAVSSDLLKKLISSNMSHAYTVLG